MLEFKLGCYISFELILSMDCWNLVRDLIGKGGPILLVPSGLFIRFNPFVLCLVWWIFVSISMHLIVTFRRALCSDSRASSPVLHPLKSRALLNWISWALRKPQSLLISPQILKILWSLGRDLLGICSRGRAKQSPKFHRLSWSFGRVSPFESKIFGVFWVPPVRPVGETGQTDLLAFAQPRPVRPVQCTSQTGPGWSVLQFSRIASELLWVFTR